MLISDKEVYGIVPCYKCGVMPERLWNGFMCPVCGEDNKRCCIGGELEFEIKNWNEYNSKDRDGNIIFPVIKIDNQYWYWGSLQISLYYMGYTINYEKSIILFKTSKEREWWFKNKKNGYTCIIDNERYLPDLEIMDIWGKVYEVPWLNMPKSSKKAYAYLTMYGALFSDYSYPVVSLCTDSFKYNNLASDLIEKLTPRFDFYIHRNDRLW